MDQNHKVSLSAYDHHACYRRLLDHLVYLTITRPKVSHVVHALSQSLQRPLQEHYYTLLRELYNIKSNHI